MSFKLAAPVIILSLSPRRGRFDATIARHDAVSFGVLSQGPALRRRFLYDRQRAISEYRYRRRPGTLLVLTPSVWEQGLTTRFGMDLNIDDCYVAMESREDWNSNNWRYASWLFGSLPYSLVFIRSPGSPNRGRTTEPPVRKQASLPDTEHMVSSAPAIGLTPSDKRTLVLVTDHPKIWRSAWAAGWASTREELARSCTSGECLGAGGTPEPARRRALHVVGGGHRLWHAPEPGATAEHTVHPEYGAHQEQAQEVSAPGPPHRDLGQADQACRRSDLVPVGTGGGGAGNSRF